MSLQFVIDGYNITHHHAFTQSHKYSKVPPQALVKLINTKRLCGKNPAIIVFDGYPPQDETVTSDATVEIVFSREHTADELIKTIVERSRNPKNMVVVSDDNEIRFIVKALGAKVLSVEQFIRPPEKRTTRKEAPEIELTYSQMEEINKEFKKLWLQ